MERSITISRILKRWSNPHNILDRKDSNTSRQNTTLAGEQVVFIMWTSSRWKEVKGVVDDNKNHRGQGGYFSSWTQLISQEKSKCWRWSDTIVERFHEGVIDRRWQQVKGMMKRKVIETTSTIQTWNQRLLFKAKWYAEDDRRKLSYHRKLCSGNKDQVVRLKFSMIMI